MLHRYDLRSNQRAGNRYQLNLTTRRRRNYRTGQEARRDVFDYIEMFYNPKRKHARNGMLSLVEFQRQQKLRQKGF